MILRLRGPCDWPDGRHAPAALRGALLSISLIGLPGLLGPGCAQIAGLTDHQPYPITQVAAGLDHACVLTLAGTVWCWGANDTGQLGRRQTDAGAACTTACPPGAVQGISGAVGVAAGAGFTCALLGGGKVQCWGKDASGELGRSTLATCGGVPCDPAPDLVAGLASAVQITAGTGYACARTGAGGVVCWGDNAYGQLGTGDFLSSGATRPVVGITGAVDLSASLLGSTTCAAIDDGSVSCWGLNLHGAVGHTPGPTDVMATDKSPCSVTPQAVAGVGKALAVRTGDYGACAQLAAGGFSCWGYDGLGCLGTASTASPALPPAPVTVVAGLASLDLAYTTACGIDASGDAWCWGQSGLGALGPEATAADMCDNATPCQRRAQRVGQGSVMAIATGGYLAVALIADGTVTAWGENGDGRLGHPPGTHGDTACTVDATKTCNTKPVPVPGLPQ